MRLGGNFWLPEGVNSHGWPLVIPLESIRLPDDPDEEEGGSLVGDREPRNPRPIVPKLGGVAINLPESIRA